MRTPLVCLAAAGGDFAVLGPLLLILRELLLTLLLLEPQRNKPDHPGSYRDLAPIHRFENLLGYRHGKLRP